ncbi:MAG: hypothetical protein WAQ27_01075 [Candidatus Microsaccharimonas sp.]
MNWEANLNDLGLLLDIIGAVLLFFYGLAPLLNKDGAEMLVVGTSEHIAAKARQYELKARVGLMLIFLGFTGQLLSNHIVVSFSWSYIVGGVVVILSGIGVVSIVRMIKRQTAYLVFEAHYLPQFDKEGKNRFPDHLWMIVIKNRSDKVADKVKLELPYAPQVAVRRIQGEQLKILTPNRKINIGSVRKGKGAFIFVWGLAGNIEAGYDLRIEAFGKSILPSKVISDYEIFSE